MELLLLLPICFPILAGIALLLKKEFGNRRALLVYVGTALLVTGALAFGAIFAGGDGVTLFWLTETLPVSFKIDVLGGFFASVVSIAWILAGFFSFEYMRHETREKRG